ncbi:MAG TPA: tetratricopeptide repeat protein, partial [Thermoanaerobaculia bacterium]|nr:tetratricopeptide repeat protein [Thermoanaerobaculia bacterium]
MGEPETATAGFEDLEVEPAATVPIFLPREIAANRFRVIRLLGQGGMAQVFEAEDLELGQRVALKVMRPDLAASRRARDLLRSEALLSRKVTHPNVCRIFDVFQHSAPASDEPGPELQTLVLVMELLRGETLACRLAQGGPLTPAEALPIIAQLAEALDAAHRSQVTHGDFKSGNVILEPTPSGLRAVVTDFGLARHTGAASGCAGGTTAYMAPELLLRRDVTAASDIYALGVVICEMVGGVRPAPDCDSWWERRPFGRKSSSQAAIQGLPPAWRQAVQSCLAGLPQDRPASAAAVARSLVEAGPRRTVSRAARGHLLLRAGMLVLLSACLGLVEPGNRPAHRLRVASIVADRRVLPAARPAVAIEDLRDSSPSRQSAWLAAALGHRVLLEIAAGGQVETLQVPAGAGGLDADLVTSGSFALSGDGDDPTIRIAVAVRQARQGRDLAAIAESGSLSRLSDLMARLGGRARRAIGIAEITPQDRAAMEALRPATLEAEGLYAEGLDLLGRQQLMAAHAVLGRALQADPEFALSHAALARACADLGHDQRARAEALQAVKRGDRLPEQQRLEVSAVSRRVNADLFGAAGRFRTLWRLAPHHPDYAYQLATAQLEGARPRDAIETLQALRSGRLDERLVPALALLEAKARASLSDPRGAIAAALAAEDAAKRTDNPAVLAAAELEEASARAGDGDVEKARGLLVQVQERFAHLGDRAGQARALQQLADLADREGATDRALELDRQSLALFQQVRSTRGTAAVLTDTGVIEEKLSHLPRAARLLQRSRADFHSIGDRWNEAKAVNDLAIVAMDLQQPGRAKKLYEEAAGLDSEMADRAGLASVLINLANLEVGDGDVNAALQHLEESLRISQELGSKDGQAVAHLNLGCVRQTMGNLTAAEPELREALRLARQAHWTNIEASALGTLGQVLMQQGKLALAETTLRQALASSAGDPNMTSGLHRDLAHLELWQGKLDAAAGSVRSLMGAVPVDASKDPEALSMLAMVEA